MRTELGARVRTLVQGARSLAALARTGIVSELTLPGVVTGLGSLLRASPNPAQIYEFHARNSPRKTALVCPGFEGSADAPLELPPGFEGGADAPLELPTRTRRVTFAELYERMNRAASALQRRGVGRGSSVALLMRNRPEFLEVQGAAGLLGAAAVSVSWRSTPAELAYIATHCGARAVVFEGDLGPVVEQARRSLGGIAPGGYIAVGGAPGAGWDRYEEDFLAGAESCPRVERGASADAAVVVYTSGTTGKPKGAVRKFPKGALFGALSFLAETPMRADDVHLVACPLYHSTAFAFLTLTGALGATSVLLDEFTPQAFLEHVERFGVTTTAVVPTMLHRVLALGPESLAAHDTRSLRAVFSGGAPLSASLALDVMDRFGDVLFNFYGATETGLVTLAKPSDLRAAPGTIGTVVPGNEVRLLDEQGRQVPEGEVGELFARSALLAAGYHGDAESTRASMREGFFSVGDLARRDRAGRYFLEGRKRDMIISGGVNVYPAEVEAVLEAHAEVAEAAVVGVEDAEWGERVRAFVVCVPGATLDEHAVKAWCRARLAGPKLPREVVFLDSLPRNPTGKVLKRELRDRR